MSCSEPEKKSDKIPDLTNRNRGVWLVKVPNYISDRWDTVDGVSIVGRLRISKQKSGRPDVSFSLNDGIIGGGSDCDIKKGTNKQIPKEHKLIISNVAGHSMAIFSATSITDSAGNVTGESLSLEGRVVQRADCIPISNKVYMSLKREALMKVIEPARKTKRLDKIIVSYKPVSKHQFDIEYDRKKGMEGKKSIDDKDKLLSKLFYLFEKHQYYNIKDLVSETRQPVTYLKEILREVCNYNLKNPYKNMWELKEEYRHYAPTE